MSLGRRPDAVGGTDTYCHPVGYIEIERLAHVLDLVNHFTRKAFIDQIISQLGYQGDRDKVVAFVCKAFTIDANDLYILIAQLTTE